jgi:uncharacterized protein
MTAADLASQVGDIVRRVPGVRVAYLFGSRATGHAWGESDLDVAVRFDHQMDDAARASARLDLIEALTESLGALGERADVADLDRVSTAVAFQAVQSGRCVYAKSKSDRVRAVVDVMRRYDDDAPRRALFRSAALRAVARMTEGPDGRR